MSRVHAAEAASCAPPAACATWRDLRAMTSQQVVSREAFWAGRATGRLSPSRDCRPSGLAASKLPFANYGTRPVAACRSPEKRTFTDFAERPFCDSQSRPDRGSPHWVAMRSAHQSAPQPGIGTWWYCSGALAHTGQFGLGTLFRVEPHVWQTKYSPVFSSMAFATCSNNMGE
jgi:hypothetical protein